MAASEWTTTEHAVRYLACADALPHRTEGEAVLLDHVGLSARRILDLGNVAFTQPIDPGWTPPV